MGLSVKIANAKGETRNLKLDFLTTNVWGMEPSLSTTVKENVIESTLAPFPIEPLNQNWCHVKNIVVLGENLDIKINGEATDNNNNIDDIKIEMPVEFTEVKVLETTDAELVDVIGAFYDPNRHLSVSVANGVFTVDIYQQDVVAPPYGDGSDANAPSWQNSTVVNKDNKVFFLYTKISLPYYLRTMFGANAGNEITETIDGLGDVYIQNKLSSYHFNVQYRDQTPNAETLMDSTRVVWFNEEAYLRIPMHFVPHTQEVQVLIDFSKVSNFFGPEKGQTVNLTTPIFQLRLNNRDGGEPA